MEQHKLCVIKLRVSPREKSIIECAANDFGSSISAYGRHKLLEHEKSQLTGKELQNVVASLCNLCRLTGKISDEALRADIEKEVAELWRLLE